MLKSKIVIRHCKKWVSPWATIVYRENNVSPWLNVSPDEGSALCLSHRLIFVTGVQHDHLEGILFPQMLSKTPGNLENKITYLMQYKTLAYDSDMRPWFSFVYSMFIDSNLLVKYENILVSH